jgi:Xaa-Pro aminopeptidase
LLLISDAAKSIEFRVHGTSTKFSAVKNNLVDKVHTPAPRSAGPLKPYPVSLSGQSTKSKLKRMRAQLATIARTDNWLYLIPTLPTLTWLLNYRCPSDIPYCPVAFAYAALTPDSCIIFIDPRKARDEDLLDDWREAGVKIHPYGIDEVEKAVKEVGIKAQGDKSKFKIMAAKESNWALISACAPVSDSRTNDC